MLVFIPLDVETLHRWAEGGSHQPAQAFAVTGALRTAFGFGPNDEEDAEHTVLHVAGVAALLTADRRLVAVAEVEATEQPDGHFGQVSTGDVQWRQITALFSDDAEAVDDSLAGLDLEAAWEVATIADGPTERPLLWHGPGEWQALV